MDGFGREKEAHEGLRVINEEVAPERSKFIEIMAGTTFSERRAGRNSDDDRFGPSRDIEQSLEPPGQFWYKKHDPDQIKTCDVQFSTAKSKLSSHLEDHELNESQVAVLNPACHLHLQRSLQNLGAQKVMDWI
jgi:hypothetical protein